MSAQELPFDETRGLAQLIVRVSEELKVDFAEAAEAAGLPAHLARAIVALSDPAPMRDLADHLACDRSYITTIADQLEERGLVERAAGADRRVKLLQLTPDGLEVRHRLSVEVAARSRVMKRLTPQQRGSLGAILEELLADD
ncbi:MarR family winged helix-turn-helix transcriptional regulator [Tessaracoccus sp. G1721]